MNTIVINPIAFVKNSVEYPSDNNWADVESIIELVDGLSEESLLGIEEFSHLEIIFHFNKSSKTLTGAEHPRENPKYPKVGVFAQRKKDRPNHLGITIVKLLRKEGRKLYVTHFDAINGTPIIDIKPFMKEFIPNDKITQPKWSKDIMKNYW